MLNGLSSQELINKSLIQSGEVDKTSLGKKNPYSDIDKNLLVDESDISSEAINLYQKDLDIRKFTSLALSDLDNTDFNSLVVQNVFSVDESFNNKILEDLFSNRSFLQDLLG